MKKFWKKTEGFTLVELVVVIAILGILAGVGTVGYSGYVKKANMAADEQLIAAVNQAFAAACIENGLDQKQVASAAEEMSSDKAVTGVTVTVGGVVTSQKATDIATSFPKYFAGNENSKFKIVADLQYSQALGFYSNELMGVATKTVTFGGRTYTVKQTSIDNFKDATVFSNNISQMQGQVNTLSDSFGVVANSLGISNLAGKLGDEYASYMAASGASGATEIGNATVLYVAEKSANMTAQDAMDSLCNAAYYLQANAGSNPDLYDVLNAAKAGGDSLTTAAIMYGAVTAYANDPANNATALKTQAAGVNNAVTLLELFKTAAADPGFTQYCGTYDYNSTGVISTSPSEAFVRDMDGYLGALDAMNTVSGGINTSTDDVWISEDINALLTDIMK